MPDLSGTLSPTGIGKYLFYYFMLKLGTFTKIMPLTPYYATRLLKNTVHALKKNYLIPNNLSVTFLMRTRDRILSKSAISAKLAKTDVNAVIDLPQNAIFSKLGKPHKTFRVLFLFH